MINNDLISRSALLDSYDVRWVTEYDETGCGMNYKAVPVEAIEKAPAVDAVSLGVFEQVKWERDTAISQLKEIGIGFGQKMPDMVEVVRCKDCKHFLEYSPTYEGEVQGADGDCFIRLRHTEYEPQFCAVQKCEFCSFGERNEVRYV